MAGRPKDSESWCKNIDGCTLAKKHAGQCKPASSANERSARSNCGGPHEYPAALERIRKLNNDPANDKPDPSGLRAAGAKLAEDEKKANGKAAKPPRMQLGFSTRDVEPGEEEIELPTELSATELSHQGAINAQTQGEIDRLEGEIALNAEAYKKKRKEDKKTLLELQRTHKEGSREVRDKTRMMLQKVRIEHDFGLGASRYYRMDRGENGVGELYATEPMDPQLRAKLAKKAGKAAPPADPPAMDPPDAPAVEGGTVEPDKLN